jgi:hypothetical protein
METAEPFAMLPQSRLMPAGSTQPASMSVEGLENGDSLSLGNAPKQTIHFEALVGRGEIVSIPDGMRRL